MATDGVIHTMAGVGVDTLTTADIMAVDTTTVVEAITTTHVLQHIMQAAEANTIVAAEQAQEPLMQTAEAHTIAAEAMPTQEVTAAEVLTT